MLSTRELQTLLQITKTQQQALSDTKRLIEDYARANDEGDERFSLTDTERFIAVADKYMAIRLHNDRTKKGLRESKEFVDSILG